MGKETRDLQSRIQGQKVLFASIESEFKRSNDKQNSNLFYTFCLVSLRCLKKAFKVGRSCSSSVSYFASRDVHLSDISNEKVFKQQEKNTVNVGVST